MRGTIVQLEIIRSET